MSGMNKITIERNQKIVLELAQKPGNGKDICADCKARNPRWASHNLGIFICVNCASIHRKIGTHITKVKSLTMDSWTKEQVETIKAMGNVNSNAIFNPNEIRHPPPPNLMDSERDSELEQYIRSKYEYKRFLDRSALVSSKLGPSRSASSVTSSSSLRSVSTPLTQTSISQTPSTTPSSQTLPYQRPSAVAVSSSTIAQSRSVSQPLSLLGQNQSQQPPQSKPNVVSDVWADLASLQAPASSSSLPLQFQALPSQQNQPLSSQGSFSGSVNTYQTGMTTGVNPYQQQYISANPYAQQPYSTATNQPSQFSTSSYSPATTLNQQQNYFAASQLQMQHPMSAPGQANNQYFHPQPQQGALQVQVPSFVSNNGQGSFMSAPPGQAQFLSSSPAQQFLSHSPQPQMQVISTTPQPQVQQGQYMSPSPQLQMGMMSSTPQGHYSTTPQPQMQMQMQAQQGYYIGGAQQPQVQMGQQPQTQFGGFQGQGQQSLFGSGGYNNNNGQWGAM